MTIDGYTITPKYAQAFMRVFGTKIEKETVASLRSAVRYMEAKPFFPQLLLILAGKKHTDQQLLMEQYLQQLRLPDYFAPLLFLLIKKKHTPLLPVIFEQILHLWYDKEQVQSVTLYTPVLLSDEQKDFFLQFIATKRDKKVLFSEVVLQPELIAGIKIVSSDGYKWEYSLLEKITKITAILRQEGIHRE